MEKKAKKEEQDKDKEEQGKEKGTEDPTADVAETPSGEGNQGEA
jgi:hypothetical protein